MPHRPRKDLTAINICERACLLINLQHKHIKAIILRKVAQKFHMVVCDLVFGAYVSVRWCILPTTIQTTLQPQRCHAPAGHRRDETNMMLRQVRLGTLG